LIITKQPLKLEEKQKLGNLRILENVDVRLIKFVPVQLFFLKLANDF
jgi:hypothetical protein